MPSAQPTGQPTGQPSVQPSSQPSGAPTGQPSVQPSSYPSRQPTCQPSGQPMPHPSSQPTGQPSRLPTYQPYGVPTGQPSILPSSQPSGLPTGRPSVQPSSQPSSQPSLQPSNQPSAQPSVWPSCQPSRQPSSQPTCGPTRQPSRQPTAQPSYEPTCRPSMQPTKQPASEPTGQPSRQPSLRPSCQPTGQPSFQPSSQPSDGPSCQPSSQPSGVPSGQPSLQPSSQPSCEPTGQPSRQPSVRPSRLPSMQPSSQPSRAPTCQPSGQPSSQPTCGPTRQPSRQPTAQPSCEPSCRPSMQPTKQPASEPKGQPSRQPSLWPSCQPTGQPSFQPSSQPSDGPSCQPSVQPVSLPSHQPIGNPSVQPSSQPSGVPSGQPSLQPSSPPSDVPTGQPSRLPSVRPSRLPSMQPSSQPSRAPTCQPSGQPLSVPSGEPTCQPSPQPSSQPSGAPSEQASMLPSLHPFGQPTGQPSLQPRSQPSRQPTFHASMTSAQQPTGQPTCQPIGHPAVAMQVTTFAPSLSPQISRSPFYSPTTASPSYSPTLSSTFFAFLPGDGNRTNVGNGTLGRRAVNASLAFRVLASLASDFTEGSIVTADVKFVSQTLLAVNKSMSISIALPMTAEEVALHSLGQLVVPSISLGVSVSSSANNSINVYVAVALISSTLWTPPARPWNASSVPDGTNTETSPPLAEKLGLLQSDVISVLTIGNGVNFVEIEFPAGSIARLNSTPSINFTIYCPPRRVQQKYFYCNDTGYVEYVQCNGLASIIRGSCPKLEQICAALDLASMTVARNNLCQTKTYNGTLGEANSSPNAKGLLCTCGMGEGGLNAPGSLVVAAGVVLGLGPSDLSMTFQASSAFGDGSAASKAAIVLSVFVSIWAAALMAVFYMHVWKVDKPTRNTILDNNRIHHHQKERNSSLKLKLSLPLADYHVGLTDEVEHLHVDGFRHLVDGYLAVLFPAVFLPSSLLEGLCRELYRKHMYVRFFLRLSHSQSPVVDIVKIVTLQSFLLFLLALLYDLNFPSDDGNCIHYVSENTCLQRRLYFDASQTYCQWIAFPYADLLASDDDAVYFECIYGEPSVSLTAATYMSMILSLATCLAMDPLEYIVSLLSSPTLENASSSATVPSQLKPPTVKRQQSALAPSGLQSDSLRISATGVDSRKESVVRDTSWSTPKVKAIDEDNAEISIKQRRTKFARVLPVQLSSRPPALKFSATAASKDCTMASLEMAIQRQRLLYLHQPVPSVRKDLTWSANIENINLLSEFDHAWCLDSSTGLFVECRSKLQSVFLRQRVEAGIILSMRDVIQQDILKVQEETVLITEELQEESHTAIGFEIMLQFVQDVLGRRTTAARIYALKMEMDYEKLQRVGKLTKAALVLMLVCLNGMFFYFTLLRGISKGLAWQRSYLAAWLLQTVIDIFVFESMQVAWFHYFIPSFVKEEVCAAKAILEETFVKAIGRIQQNDLLNVDKHFTDDLNSPDYLFVSYQLADVYPQLVESFVVQQYRSRLPNNAGSSWLKLLKHRAQHSPNAQLDSNLPSSSNTRDIKSNGENAHEPLAAATSRRVLVQPNLIAACWRSIIDFFSFLRRGFYCVRYFLVAVILQVAIFAPIQVQSLLFRVFEPVVMSGVLFFFLLVSSRPIFLALTIVLLAALIASVVWEHVHMVREHKKVAIGARDDQNSVVHTASPAAAAVATDKEQPSKDEASRLVAAEEGNANLHMSDSDGNLDSLTEQEKAAQATDNAKVDTTNYFCSISISSSRPSSSSSSSCLSSYSTADSLMMQDLLDELQSNMSDGEGAVIHGDDA